MPAGRDLFGEVLKEARARGIRFIGRFDLSKTQNPVFDAHPECFFKSTTGQPSIYNGLYSVCINGGYCSEQATKILTEALERSEVDGCSSTCSGTRYYSGNAPGPCQCDECKSHFHARYKREVPTTIQDNEYREFMAASAHEVAARIAELAYEV